MKRRIDTGGRGEAASGIVSTGGIAQGGQGVGGPGGVSGGPGYIRGPSLAQLGVGVRPGQSNTPIAVPVTGAGAPVPVVPIPATTAGGPGVGVAPTLDHQTHNTSQTGYASGKIDMHTVHHSVPAYSANLATAPASQGGGLAGVVEGRAVGGTGGLGAPSGVGPPPSVLQHVTAHSQMRHKVSGMSSANVVHQNTAAVGAVAAAAAAGATQGSGQFQRLKVEDALSYLDQVKLRFGKQPQVYNDFLDIMKEFKSQSIDTPGVIARVSQLFRGHPELIVGFNTFLPPGYKIEVQGNEQVKVSVSVPGQQTTVVHTPQGVHHHVTPTHHPPPPPPPTVTVKPPHHPPPPRSTLQSSCIAPHTGPNLVGTHGVHNISTSGTGGTGASSAASGGSAGTNPGSGTTSVVSTGGSSQVPSNVSVGATTPTGTSASASANSNTSSVSGSQQHSTNTAPQHPSREPQPPPPHHHHHHQPPAQPVEFNHAINYVNKIKLRFQGQPDIYKQFLEILHTYQKEQRHLKEGGNTPTRTLTETEVYEKVAKLFENQEDLLQEFGQFLPDATNNSAAQAAVSDFMDQYRTHHGGNKSVTNDHTTIKKSNKSSVTIGSGNNLVSNTGSTPNKTSPMFGHQLKRPHSGPTQSHTHTHAHSQPPVKKPKLGYLKDMSAAEAGKYATLAEYAFFDQVRKALRHEEPYHNFLRVITMYNEEIITRSELVQLVHPFLAKFPDLLKWFKDFVGYREGAAGNSDIIPSTVAKQERISGDLAMEIDYTTCKRLGASYCALPKTYPQPKCSGRTSLCREVLNDTWVSFPSWSEDSTFVTSRKTQYEEYIYRCEDERFELDVVIETNLTTMRVLEGVHKKLQRMSPEEAARFRLDDSLGGNSPTIHQRAIRRIYGDKAPDILDGLKKNPVVAVPLVLRRLKAKDEEWREAQKGFNKIWREQNEKYYLKSLDHQGITFKQNDIKTIRSKSLLNDIETLFDERHEQAEESGEVLTGPHMVLHYPDKSILDDAANLVIHHVKRQTTYHKDDKAKIKHLVRHFVPDLLFHPRQEMSDDERDLEDEEDNRSEEKFETNRRDVKGRECKQAPVNPCPTTNNKRKTRRGNDVEKEIDIKKELPENFNNNNVGNKGRTLNGDATEEEKISIKTEDEKDIKLEPGIIGNGNLESDDEYRLFMCNNNWYLFLRLHQILCCRLTTMYEHAVRIAAEEAKDKKDRKEATAVALRLKPKNELAVEDYYPALLDMIKNVLDGNLEPTAYEDTLREMFGIHAFTGFTLDKVVTGAVRQLQHLVCDDPPLQCTTSYIMEAKRGAAGGPVASAHRRLNLEQSYQKKLERQLQDENCFKIYTYKKNCRMTIELIDTEIEEEENPGAGMGHSTTASNHPAIPPAVAEVERWSEYVEKYVSSVAPQMSPSMQAQLSRKPVFLPRNLRSWRKLTTARQTNQEMDKRSCTEDIKPPVCPEMEILDNTQCKFNLSSFKMVFVVNSDSYMYKKQALKRAKQSHEHVSKRMHMGLTSWHSDWCSKHVSEAGQNFATDWFLGHTEGLRPNKTRIVRVDNPSRPPFAPYNKYKCELDESGGGS